MEPTQLDIVKQFVEFVRNEENDLDAILREYGGGAIYIPTLRTTMRDRMLHDDFIAMYEEGMSMKQIIRDLCRKYDLSQRRVWELTEELRRPSLF